MQMLIDHFIASLDFDKYAPSAPDLILTFVDG